MRLFLQGVRIGEWCRGRESNPHGGDPPTDFKSVTSAIPSPRRPWQNFKITWLAVFPVRRVHLGKGAPHAIFRGAEVSQQHCVGLPTGDIHDFIMRNTATVGFTCKRPTEIVEAWLTGLAILSGKAFSGASTLTRCLKPVYCSVVANLFALSIRKYVFA